MSNSWKMWQEDIQCDPTCRYYCRGLTDPCTYIGCGIRPCKTPPRNTYYQDAFSQIIISENPQTMEVNDNDIYRK